MTHDMRTYALLIVSVALLAALPLSVSGDANQLKVGDIANVGITVKNILGVTYRGYVECALKLPDGSIRNDRSGCTIFTGNANTSVDVPVSLTQAGNWNVSECTVWAEVSTELPESRCMQAATRFSTLSSGASFLVAASDIAVNSPSAGSLVRGLVAINATVSGYFSGIDWSLGAADGCFGATWNALSNSTTAFTKDWTGTWDSTTLPNGEYFMCFRGRMGDATTALRSVRVGTNNWAFIFNPVEAELNSRSRSTRQYYLVIRNIGSSTDTFTVNCSAPANWSTSITGQGRTVACGSSLTITLAANQSEDITASTIIPNVATGTKATVSFTAKGRYETANAIQQHTISGVSNDAPRLLNSSTNTVSILPGESITFRARISDPNGDDIASTKVCADAGCTQIICTLSGAVEKTCSAALNLSIGTHKWWVQAEDSLGLSSTSIGGEFTVREPPAPPCTFSCMADCTSNPTYCKNRTDYEQRNCTTGLTCCRETQILNCIEPPTCSVVLKLVSCNWDPVNLNYSVNVQAEWSGGTRGIYAKISAAGIVSGAINAKPATFNGKVLTAGTKTVTASVYDIADAALCSNATSVTCARPDAQPAGSPVNGSLPITAASASSFVTGNEPSKAIDNDQFTAWQSRAGMPQWLKLDLGMSKTIGGVGIYSSNGRPTAFTISTSLDDRVYSQAASVRNANYSFDWNVTMFSARDARYVMLNITAAEQNSTFIYEVKVYPGAGPSIIPPPTGGAAEFPWTLVVIIFIVIAAVALVLSRYKKRISLWWSYVTSR